MAWPLWNENHFIQIWYLGVHEHALYMCSSQPVPIPLILQLVENEHLIISYMAYSTECERTTSLEQVQAPQLCTSSQILA